MFYSLFRYSSRSERSDYGGDRRGGDYHRETPSRDLGGRRRSSREDDFAPQPPPLHNNYNSSRLKDRKSDEKQGKSILLIMQIFDFFDN